MSDDFDDKESRKRKIEGMKQAADGNPDSLAYSQLIAWEIAKAHPGHLCDADKVGRERGARGLNTSIGPAAGSLFRNGMWDFTGHRRLSSRKSNHARELKVWILREAYR